MVDVRDPSTPPPHVPGPPPRKGMSTGVKIAIGCGVIALLAVVVIVIVSVFIQRKAQDIAGGMEAQEEASQKIRELEEEHPFTPPAGGVVDEGRAEEFFDVTDDAWERMRESMEEVTERERAIDEEGGAAGFGDAMAGLQALGRSRVALAEALDANEMPVSEYLWTGLTLVRAYEALDATPEQSGVPPENLEIATEHREELAEIAESSGEEEADKSVVLGMAWTWGMSEGVAPEAMGWDTLGGYVP